jgi:stage II sporulation protein E
MACNGICGDSFVITELNNGKFISVISDGMGTGEKACQESQTAITLLESLLNSGFDNQVALKTINSVLMLRSDQESFTTMDMLLIDLFTGQGEIIKTAAAPSFVKRGSQIEMICSSSLPVGILQEMDAFRQNITLTTDDMVIMVSDGVIEATRNKSATNWLPNLLRGIIEDDCQRLAEYILSQAVNLSQGKPKDDMTVICLRIAYR